MSERHDDEPREPDPHVPDLDLPIPDAGEMSADEFLQSLGAIRPVVTGRSSSSHPPTTQTRPTQAEPAVTPIQRALQRAQAAEQARVALPGVAYGRGSMTGRHSSNTPAMSAGVAAAERLERERLERERRERVDRQLLRYAMTPGIDPAPGARPTAADNSRDALAAAAMAATAFTERYGAGATAALAADSARANAAADDAAAAALTRQQRQMAMFGAAYGRNPAVIVDYANAEARIMQEAQEYWRPGPAAVTPPPTPEPGETVAPATLVNRAILRHVDGVVHMSFSRSLLAGDRQTRPPGQQHYGAHHVLATRSTATRNRDRRTYGDFTVLVFDTASQVGGFTALTIVSQYMLTITKSDAFLWSEIMPRFIHALAINWRKAYNCLPQFASYAPHPNDQYDLFAAFPKSEPLPVEVLRGLNPFEEKS